MSANKIFINFFLSIFLLLKMPIWINRLRNRAISYEMKKEDCIYSPLYLINNS